MQATILFLYLVTGKPPAIASLATVEFGSKTACETAGREAAARLGTSATTAYWFCTPKGGADPEAPQGR